MLIYTKLCLIVRPGVGISLELKSGFSSAINTIISPIKAPVTIVTNLKRVTVHGVQTRVPVSLSTSISQRHTRPLILVCDEVSVVIR